MQAVFLISEEVVGVFDAQQETVGVAKLCAVLTAVCDRPSR